ncbi:MAG TPA: hypothetical protein VFC78_15370 [Tepidisphaeraceae bacterium]|nr:hypothetical protein [Tepidisphaeraceae bacterium]
MSPQKKSRTSPLETAGARITLDTRSLEITRSVTYNVTQDFIVITRDKVELCLTKHVKTMEGRQAWIAPGSLFLAAVAALVTSTFHEWIGIPADFWRMLFVVCALVCFVVMIILLVRRRKAKTISQVIDELMAQGAVQENLASTASASSVSRTEKMTESLAAQSPRP